MADADGMHRLAFQPGGKTVRFSLACAYLLVPIQIFILEKSHAKVENGIVYHINFIIVSVCT